MKKFKDQADYRRFDTSKETCGNCKYMNPDGTCQRVVGKVDKKHVCDLWERDAS